MLSANVQILTWDLCGGGGRGILITELSIAGGAEPAGAINISLNDKLSSLKRRSRIPNWLLACQPRDGQAWPGIVRRVQPAFIPLSPKFILVMTHFKSRVPVHDRTPR